MNTRLECSLKKSHQLSLTINGQGGAQESVERRGVNALERCVSGLVGGKRVKEEGVNGYKYPHSKH